MALSSKEASNPSVNLHIADVKVADGKAFVGYNNTTNNTYNTYKAADGDADNRCLSAWRLTDPREDKDRILSSKDPLLEGSCSWILDDRAFTQWWNNDESRILWIHGNPGKGKTMIIMSLIREISRRFQSSPGSGILSYFFCQNTIKELSSAGSIVRGLVYLLAAQNPALIHHLRKKYDEAGSRLFDGVNSLHAFWATLIEMLQDPSLPRVYLMVDALDECELQSLKTFLHLLTQDTSDLSAKVKWVVTSRNEPSISEYLECAHLRYDTSLELNSSHVSEAVKSFINFKVRELAARKKYRSELQRSIVEYLTGHADGTFLWVALVCKELEKVQAWRAQDVCRRFPAGLKHLYQRMMEQIQHDKDMEEVELCVQILCTATLACRPLHLTELGVIAGLPEDLCNDSQALQDLVESCGSFLTLRKQTVYFVHQSVKDYFSTGNGSKIFPSEQSKAHGLLADRSLRLMSESLRRDACSLRRPGTLMREVDNDIIGRYIPAHVQYACCYWVHHLKESGFSPRENGQMHRFLKEHLLHWLETFSLIRKTSEGVLAIKSLEGLVTATKSPSLHAFVQDAKRFALNNRSIIEETPLQIYCSALVFAPDMSLVRNQFAGQMPGWIARLPKVQKEWSSALQTLEGHSYSVEAVAFSPDGNLVASASGDKTVRLWDSTTGAALQTLEGHSSSVKAVAFSPDGNLVASASFDKTVRLWDSTTGAALQKLNIGSVIYTLTFSSDGFYLDTDRGRLNIKPLSLNRVPLQTNALWDILVEETWVTYKMEKVLWLPSEYRAKCSAVQSNMLVLGHASGRVTSFEFDFSQYVSVEDSDICN